MNGGDFVERNEIEWISLETKIKSLDWSNIRLIQRMKEINVVCCKFGLFMRQCHNLVNIQCAIARIGGYKKFNGRNMHITSKNI